MAERSWRAKLEVRADQEGFFSLVACSSESEATIMSGLSRREAEETCCYVNRLLESQLKPITETDTNGKESRNVLAFPARRFRRTSKQTGSV
jgi:hypothetical protein